MLYVKHNHLNHMNCVLLGRHKTSIHLNTASYCLNPMLNTDGLEYLKLVDTISSDAVRKAQPFKPHELCFARTPQNEYTFKYCIILLKPYEHVLLMHPVPLSSNIKLAALHYLSQEMIANFVKLDNFNFRKVVECSSQQVQIQ